MNLMIPFFVSVACNKWSTITDRTTFVNDETIVWFALNIKLTTKKVMFL